MISGYESITSPGGVVSSEIQRRIQKAKQKSSELIQMNRRKEENVSKRKLKCLLKQQRQPGVCLLPCTPLFSSPPPSAPTPRPIPLFCLINPRTRPSSSAVWKLPALPSRIYDCSSQFGLIKLEQAFKRFI